MCKQKDQRISDFLKKEKPEEYDFKLEMKNYYKDNNKNVNYDGLIKEIESRIKPEEDSIKNWFAYKTLEKDMGRKKNLFDCDNSNDTCKLSELIYRYLWGWEEGKNNFRKLLILQKENNGMTNTFGGDTMNSLGTTLRKYMDKNSVNECKKEWDKTERDKADLDSMKHLHDFAQYTSCIGNFVLVPAGFNGHRGIHPCIKDYWDLSLDYLAYTEKNAWLSNEKRLMKQKAAQENSAFVKYINMFFLWDYVDKNYEVKSLFASHENILGAKICSVNDVLPEDESEFSSYFENANTYIKRRGIFMVAMLNIAYRFEDVEIEYTNKAAWKDWKVSDIYKYIVEKVFLTDKEYSGYEGVIEAIKNAVKKDVVSKENISKIRDYLKDLKIRLEI